MPGVSSYVFQSKYSGQYLSDITVVSGVGTIVMAVSVGTIADSRCISSIALVEPFDALAASFGIPKDDVSMKLIRDSFDYVVHFEPET